MSQDGIETTRERMPLATQRLVRLDDQRDLAARWR